MRAICSFAAVGLLASCGGSPSNLTAPSPAPTVPPSNVRPAGTVLSIASLASTQPIAGAALTTVGGQRFQADLDGRITLTSSVPTGQVITVAAPGYLDRRTILLNHLGFDLWPRTDAGTNLSEDFTRDVVYRAECGARSPQRMVRLSPGVTRVFVAPTPDIMEQTQPPQPGVLPAREAHERAVAEMNRVLAPDVQFELVSSRPTAGFVVGVNVGPTTFVCTRASAFASFGVIGRGEIISGEITHCGLSTPQNDDFGTANLPLVILHEMGHIMGLAHSRDLGDVMFGCAAPGDSPTGIFRGVDGDTFSTRERLVLRMMRERPPGNAFPDDDSTILTGIAPGASQTIIVH